MLALLDCVGLLGGVHVIDCFLSVFCFRNDINSIFYCWMLCLSRHEARACPECKSVAAATVFSASSPFFPLTPPFPTVQTFPLSGILQAYASSARRAGEGRTSGGGSNNTASNASTSGQAALHRDVSGGSSSGAAASRSISQSQPVNVYHSHHHPLSHLAAGPGRSQEHMLASADYQTESIPIGGGCGDYRSSGGGRTGVSSGHASPSLSSQGSHSVGPAYLGGGGGGGGGGSAPSSYQRESFSAIGEELASSNNDAGGGMVRVGEGNFGSNRDISGLGSGQGNPPSLSGSAGTITAADTRASPGSNSPLMAGLTFSLDLAGYTGGNLSGGGGSRGGGYRGAAGSEGALSAHGSAINSPTLFGFEVDAAGRTRKPVGGGGVSGGGVGLPRSGSGRLAGHHGGGGSVGGMSGSSPSSPLGATGFGTDGSISMPRQLDIGPSLVGSMPPPPPRVDTSIFAFGRSGGGDAAVDEARRTEPL